MPLIGPGRPPSLPFSFEKQRSIVLIPSLNTIHCFLFWARSWGLSLYVCQGLFEKKIRQKKRRFWLDRENRKGWNPQALRVTTRLCQTTEDAEPQAGSLQSRWGTLQNASFVKIYSSLGTEIRFFLPFYCWYCCFISCTWGRGRSMWHVWEQRPEASLRCHSLKCLLPS